MVLTSLEVVKTIQKLLLEINRVFDGASTMSMVSGPTGLSLQTRLQTMFALKFSDVSTQAIYETILSQALNAERSGPGGFDTCIKTLLSHSSQFDAGSSICTVKTSLDDSPGLRSRLARGSDLTRVLEVLDSDLRSLMLEALNLSGFGGKIIVEKSRTDKTTVELIRGYSFGLKPAFPVVARFVDPWIACIDGYIESVAEANNLLESAADAKLPGLLFVRGLADEVIHTLKVNYDRGSLKIIPIIVPFDLEGINTLVDVATVSSSDVVSSTKGELISALRVSSLATVSSAVVKQEQVIIVNPKSYNRVRHHIEFLKTKRTESVDDSVSRLFDLRIRSLSPNQVVIKVPDSERYVITAQSIDYVLRSVRSMIEHGVTFEGLPVAGLAAGEAAAKRCITMLLRTGAVITP